MDFVLHIRYIGKNVLTSLFIAFFGIISRNVHPVIEYSMIGAAVSCMILFSLGINIGFILYIFVYSVKSMSTTVELLGSKCYRILMWLKLSYRKWIV
jgi:hypothetical protein